MKRLTWGALLLMLGTACVSTVRSTSTYEYDPAAVAVANFWSGVFFVSVVVCAAVCIVAWAIAYAISERAKYRSRRDDK